MHTKNARKAARKAARKTHAKMHSKTHAKRMQNACKTHFSVTTLATLCDVTQMGLGLYVFPTQRWPRQVKGKWKHCECDFANNFAKVKTFKVGTVNVVGLNLHLRSENIQRNYYT
jgi:hypothetical protein